MMVDEELKRIFKQMDYVKRWIGVLLPSVRQDISSIVDNQVRDSRRIERLLDDLLGYMSLGMAEKEFHALNSYYATFNPEHAKQYERFGREMSEL